jgi:hypothetical protein
MPSDVPSEEPWVNTYKFMTTDEHLKPWAPGDRLTVKGDGTWRITGQNADSGTYAVLNFPSGDIYLAITKDHHNISMPYDCPYWSDNSDWWTQQDPQGGDPQVYDLEQQYGGYCGLGYYYMGNLVQGNSTAQNGDIAWEGIPTGLSCWML